MKVKRNYLKKIIIIGLIATLTVSYSTIKNVKAQQNGVLIEEKYYIDGKEYLFKLDETMNMIVETDDGEILTLNEKGEGVLETNEKSDDGSYQIEIDELSNNALDIEISDESGNDVSQLSDEVSDAESVEELLNSDSDEYVGQSSASQAKNGLIGLLGACLATIIWAGAKIISGVAALVGSKVKEALQKKPKSKNYYYAAEIVNGDCYVLLGKTISLSTAANRLNSKRNIYSYYPSNARKAIVKSRYYVYKNKNGGETEIDSYKNRKKGKTYYWHYHIATSGNKKVSNVHAWYGSPVIK